MADFTKKAIRDSFIKLLNERPLKQISVRDIVDDCGINRNTFYYHFLDIPTLMETIVRDDADQLIAQFPKISSIEECLNAIVSFSLKNKRSVLHIYRSINRDIYEQYQWRICEYAANCYLDEALSGRQISDTDRYCIVLYFKCVSFGLVSDWLDQGMQEDVLDFIHRICKLKEGELEQMLERCQLSE